MNWAMRQRPDGPSAQIVLFVIADRANERGVCRHADPDDIADISRQSRATVFRRLDELERVGLITRFLRHGERGEREYEIRLNLDAVADYDIAQDRETGRRVIRLRDGDAEAREIVLRGSEGERGEPAEVAPEALSEGGESQFETRGESQIETVRVSPVRLGESHSCDSQKKNPSKSPLPTPKAPSLGETPQGGRGNESIEVLPDQGLEAFRRTYPASSNRPAEVVRLWAGLSADERRLATTGARGLAEQRRRNPRQSVLDPARYLRDPALWAEHARFAPAEPVLPVWVRRGSPEWQGRSVLAAIRRRPMSPAARCDGQDGEGAWMAPLPDHVAALAPFAAVPIADWPIVEPNTPKFIRWAEWLRPLGVKLEAQWERVPGQTTTLRTMSKTINDAPVRREGARVPCDWPPARTGPIGTGPPATDPIDATAADELAREGRG